MIQQEIESQYRHTPQHEYYLQGSVLDASRDILLDRLQGLCDMNLSAGTHPGGAPVGGPQPASTAAETFQDHEAVYVAKAAPVSSAGGSAAPSVCVRARRSLDMPSAPYQLRYVGVPETTGDQCPTMLRTSLDVATGSNLPQFLTEMGFQLDYEYLTKGFIFTKGNIKVLVYKLFRVGASPTPVPGDQPPPGGPPVEAVGRSHLVEVNTVTSPGHTAAASEVKAFADLLKPLVHLDKLDSRRLLQ